MRLRLLRLFDGLEGFVALAAGVGGHLKRRNETYDFKKFVEDFYPWPEQADAIVEKALKYAPTADIYICPLLRTERSRKQGTGSLGRFAWADLDAEPAGMVGAAARPGLIRGRLGLRDAPLPVVAGAASGCWD